MHVRHRDDRGQALPVYITVIGALLFLAFAYFAVGQAAATRNGAQTAADAAALAAADDTRDQLHTALGDVISGALQGDVGQLLNGHWPGLRGSCATAGRFAQANKAHAHCEPVPGPGYKVTVETDYTVGTSVVPGTETKTGHATATAVLTPRCTFQAGPPAPTATPTPAPTSTPAPPAGSSAAPAPPAAPSPRPTTGTLVCGGTQWAVDPKNPASLPPVSDLFSVHLTD